MNTRLWPNGVARDQPGVVRFKKELEVLEPDIRAEIQAVPQVILLEGHHDTRHRNVIVDDKVRGAGQQHQVQGPEAGEFF